LCELLTQFDDFRLRIETSCVVDIRALADLVEVLDAGIELGEEGHELLPTRLLLLLLLLLLDRWLLLLLRGRSLCNGLLGRRRCYKKPVSAALSSKADRKKGGKHGRKEDLPP
jgi:hypothetical protein